MRPANLSRENKSDKLPRTIVTVASMKLFEPGGHPKNTSRQQRTEKAATTGIAIAIANASRPPPIN